MDEYEKKKKAECEIVTKTVEEVAEDGTVTTTTTTTTTKVETVVVGKKATTKSEPVPEKPTSIALPPKSVDPIPPTANGTTTPALPNVTPDVPDVPDTSRSRYRGSSPRGAYGDSPESNPAEVPKGKVAIDHDDPNTVCVGLRVYTHKDVPTVVAGRLKADSEQKVDSDDS